ncbi:MAG: hypothetical protein HYW24_01295 [Candidatus Aenigmarchaeota archaeon]|nr:hypothetical protein [Candidatus Aenigmarchaeota archaeon]
MEVFTKDEIRDIVISVLALVFIFSWQPFPNFGLNFGLVPYFIVIVLVAFLLHELAHKFVARKFGLAAFYKMWPQGLLIGMLFMIFGLKFAAPGAVVVHPYRFGRWGYRRSKLGIPEMGAIAMSGPAVNIIMAAFFSLFQGQIFSYLTFINGWLAFFNLFPFPPLDGSKVLMWKPWIWGFMISISLVFVIMFLGRI